MRSPWGQKVRDQLLHWSVQLQGVTDTHRLRRAGCPLLIFFHGDSLAHTIRPRVMGRSLRERGYPVVFAGTGVHRSRILAEGFPVHEVTTLPQRRMNEYVAHCDYAWCPIFVEQPERSAISTTTTHDWLTLRPSLASDHGSDPEHLFRAGSVPANKSCNYTG